MAGGKMGSTLTSLPPQAIPRFCDLPGKAIPGETPVFNTLVQNSGKSLISEGLVPPPAFPSFNSPFPDGTAAIGEAVTLVREPVTEESSN